VECVPAVDDRSDPSPLRRTGEMPAGTELILLEVSELSLARLAGGVRSAIIGDSCGRGSTGREMCYASNMQIFLETDKQCVDTDTDTHTHTAYLQYLHGSLPPVLFPLHLKYPPSW